MDLHDVRLGRQAQRRRLAARGRGRRAGARGHAQDARATRAVDPDPPSATPYADTGDAVTLTRPASADAPGYTLTIAKSPFEITTARGGQTVLATTGSTAPRTPRRASSPADTAYSATRVTSARLAGGSLTLDLPRRDPGATRRLHDHAQGRPLPAFTGR